MLVNAFRNWALCCSRHLLQSDGLFTKVSKSPPPFCPPQEIWSSLPAFASEPHHPVSPPKLAFPTGTLALPDLEMTFLLPRSTGPLWESAITFDPYHIQNHDPSISGAGAIPRSAYWPFHKAPVGALQISSSASSPALRDFPALFLQPKVSGENGNIILTAMFLRDVRMTEGCQNLLDHSTPNSCSKNDFSLEPILGPTNNN